MSEIRKMKVGDEQGLIDFFTRLVKEDPERVERLSEVEKITIEQEEAWIKSRIVGEGSGEIFSLIGLVDKEVVVQGEVERRPRWIERHVAEIRFGMLPKNNSITSKLIEKLIVLAKENEIETLMYFHLETQKEGINLMKELGFSEAGRIKDYYKRGNSYVDRIYLTKHL